MGNGGLSLVNKICSSSLPLEAENRCQGGISSPNTSRRQQLYQSSYQILSILPPHSLRFLNKNAPVPNVPRPAVQGKMHLHCFLLPMPPWHNESHHYGMGYTYLDRLMGGGWIVSDALCRLQSNQEVGGFFDK